VSALPESFWSTLPLGPGVQLLARDPNGLAAFDKPAGVLSHPNKRGDEPRSLLSARYDAIGEFFYWNDEAAGEGSTELPPRLWLLNRLDSHTSGVILAAANEELAREIRTQFERREVRKTYRALVFGAPIQRQQSWRDRLFVRRQGGHIRATTDGGLPAESLMQVIRTGRRTPRLSLLQLEPHTGRSHQLRAQCTKRGLPIVGDASYGDFKRNREFARRTGCKRLFLHSLESSFDYRLRGKRFSFSAQAPLPPEFEEFL
jgi:tRNA pseudouridine65 synthase